MEKQMLTDNMAFEDLMFDAPVPGQSLTQPPEKRMPYESPPEFTNFEKAQEHLFEVMMESGGSIVEQLNNAVPVSFIGPQFPVMGAAKGKWNPDLMLLLIEPSIYITLFIAEQAGIEDYVLDFGEELEMLEPKARMKAENHIAKAIKQVGEQIKEDMQGADIQDLMPPSLLAKVGESGGMTEEPTDE